MSIYGPQLRMTYSTARLVQLSDPKKKKAKTNTPRSVFMSVHISPRTLCSESSLTFLPKIKMAATLSVRPNRFSAGSSFPRPPVRRPGPARIRKPDDQVEPWRGSIILSRRPLAWAATPVQASSRADDSAPFEMSVENALKLLGVADGASFDEILRAKKNIVASCKDDQEAIAQVIIVSLHFLFNFCENFGGI